VFRQESNVSAQGLDERVHVPPQIVELVLRRERRNCKAKLLFSRQRRDREVQLLLGCQSWQKLLNPCRAADRYFRNASRLSCHPSAESPWKTDRVRTATLASSAVAQWSCPRALRFEIPLEVDTVNMPGVV
jgi:hypothetical protein